MAPQAALLSGGRRLHLQHGPIDLIIGAEGDRDAAFAAARTAFAPLLQALVDELPALRRPPGGARPAGATAARMDAAVRPFAAAHFITPLAAVAGAVADTVLAAMREAALLRRAYVNNGGDISVYLAPGETFRMAMAGAAGADLGRIAIGAGDGVGGLATSGHPGRSLSQGIADSVTVLAASAAEADAAATLIANAVDLPGHPAIRRAPAWDCDPSSDLGHRPVVTACGALPPAAVAAALAAGKARAERFAAAGMIRGAALFLRGQSVATDALIPAQAVAPIQAGASIQAVAHA
ncbi:MAG: UPF0280 family protein [Pseudomonadota bacterium]